MTKNKTNKQASTNVQESEDLGRIQANKFLTEIAIGAEKSIRVDNLKDKLIGMWLSAPEETDSSELRTEIDIACNASESAMEGLLSKLMEERQTDGNAEESIMNKPLKLTNDERDELEWKKKDFRRCKLIDKLNKLPDVPGLPWAEVSEACGAGEDVMEEMLFKLMGTVQTDADVTNADKDESKKDGLEDKLMKIYDEFTDEAGELNREIHDARDDGVDAMEELLTKLMERAQTEESINGEHSRMDFDGQGTVARIVLPTPPSTQQKR